MNKIIKINFGIKQILNYRLILFFLLFVISYRLYYFNYFYVPNSDFFAFRIHALEWLSFDLPSSYKRLPLYPLLIGIGSLILPTNQNAILYTAEIINLVLSVVSLYLIYLISSKFLKKGAFLVVFLVALSPESVFLTCQPLLEMLLLTTILSTIYFDIRGDNKRYFFAFLASMTRYEGFLLIPILVLKDFIYSKRKLLPILLGSLSSMGMIVWMALSYFHSTGLNPYIQETLVRGITGLEFIKTCFIASLFYIPPGSHLTKEAIVFVFPLMIIGLYWLFKKSSRALFTIILFFIPYIAMHIIFASNITRYVYPVLWIFILFTVGGIEYGIEYIYIVIKKICSFERLKKRIIDLIFLSGLIIFSVLIFIISIYFHRLLDESFIFIIYLTYITCITLFAASIFGEKNPKNLFLVSSLILISCVLIGFSMYNTQNLIDSTKYTKAQFRFVGEWYTQNAKSDDKMLMTEPWVASYYTNLSYDEHFVSLSSLNCNSSDPICFISELKKNNVTYVVWDSFFGYASTSDWTYNDYKVYLISNLSEGKNTEHFRLIKKIEIGPETALIYKFIPNMAYM